MQVFAYTHLDREKIENNSNYCKFFFLLLDEKNK